MQRESVVVSDPEILGGTPCFRGTRVPVDSLIDYLEAGDSLDEFLDNFPSVSREAAIAALEEAAGGTSASIRGSHDRRIHECPHLAPSSLASYGGPHSAHPAPGAGCAPVRSTMDPAVQIGQPILQPDLILVPCHATHPRRSLPLQRVEAVPK